MSPAPDPNGPDPGSTPKSDPTFDLKPLVTDIPVPPEAGRSRCSGVPQLWGSAAGDRHAARSRRDPEDPRVRGVQG